MGVFIGTLDRFGYELTVVSSSEEKCRDLLLEEYKRAYEMRNPGEDPEEEIAEDRYSNLTYYELAKEDMAITEMELDKVEWR